MAPALVPGSMPMMGQLPLSAPGMLQPLGVGQWGAGDQQLPGEGCIHGW